MFECTTWKRTIPLLSGWWGFGGKEAQVFWNPGRMIDEVSIRQREFLLLCKLQQFAGWSSAVFLCNTLMMSAAAPVEVATKECHTMMFRALLFNFTAVLLHIRELGLWVMTCHICYRSFRRCAQGWKSWSSHHSHKHSCSRCARSSSQIQKFNAQ